MTRGRDSPRTTVIRARRRTTRDACSGRGVYGSSLCLPPAGRATEMETETVSVSALRCGRDGPPASDRPTSRARCRPGVGWLLAAGYLERADAARESGGKGGHCVRRRGAPVRDVHAACRMRMADRDVPQSWSTGLQSDVFAVAAYPAYPASLACTHVLVLVSPSQYISASRPRHTDIRVRCEIAGYRRLQERLGWSGATGGVHCRHPAWSATRSELESRLGS